MSKQVVYIVLIVNIRKVVTLKLIFELHKCIWLYPNAVTHLRSKWEAPRNAGWENLIEAPWHWSQLIYWSSWHDNLFQWHVKYRNTIQCSQSHHSTPFLKRFAHQGKWTWNKKTGLKSPFAFYWKAYNIVLWLIVSFVLFLIEDAQDTR